MFYTIYKITNKLNNKFYIGMHKTIDLQDGYMGSGKLIRAAIQKYGIENFTKEILYIFDNEEDMKNKEKELVVLSEQSYNLCEGGKGGFGYINRTADLTTRNRKISAARDYKDPKFLKNHHEAIIKAKPFRKKPVYSEQGLAKIREQHKKANTPSAIQKRKQTYKSIGHQQGEKNSNYGKPRSEETKQKIRESLARTRALKQQS